MVSFSHLDPGTPESAWTAAFADRQLPAVREDFDRLIVVVAHPDDESLGAAGLMARSVRRGAAVEVIVATDGEGSHPDSPTHTPTTLAAVRRDEVAAAMSRIGDTVRLRFLGLPDGGTDEHRDAVEQALRDALGDRPTRADERALVISTWTGDGHRDHRVVGEVVEDVCARLGVRSRAFPIWLWHWGAPEDAPWDDLERVELSPDDVEAKAAATGEHRSQVAPLSAASGDEPVLHAGMQAHFARPFEVLVAPVRSVDTMPEGYFDDFYARNDDPWGFDSRWYEARKRQLLLASLPRQRYARTLELGCSTGALTERLAERSDSVLAVDFVATALSAARERLAGRTNVELQKATLPRDWPAGTFDLVVFSEVGYYWDAADLDTGIRSMIASLRPGGHLVACHWRHPVADYPRSGDAVHEALAEFAAGEASALVRLARHEEEDVLLEVFAVPPARSVAAEAGLVP